MEGPWRLLVGAGLLLSVLHTAGSAMRCSRENIWGQTEHFFCPDAGNIEDRFCCGFGDNKYCCSTPTDEELLEDIVEKVPSAPVALAQVQAQPDPVVPRTVQKQEGVRSSVDHIKAKLNDTVTAAKDKVKTKIGDTVVATKDKVKAKINGTVTAAKDKAKQKVKDKVKEKATKKLDPTGGHLPTILGVIAAIILGLIVLCVVCCCCCPFCLLYKRRNRGTVHNPNPDVSVMQPLQNQPQSYAPQSQAAPYPMQPAYAPQPAPYPAQPGYPPQPYPPQGYPAEQPPMYTEKQPPPYNPTY